MTTASPAPTDPQRTRADRRPPGSSRVGPLTDHPVVLALLYVAAGAALAAGSLALDRWLGPDRTPSWLHVDPSVAQALTTGFGSSLLFVISVVFMVRMWAVQMSAEPLSARVRRRFLSDPVQRHAMGALVGSMTFVILVARAVPDADAGGSVPQVSVAVACAIPVMAAVLVVFALRNATHWGEIGRLIRWMTDNCLRVIEDTHPPLDRDRPAGPPATIPRGADDAGHPVLAHDSGWIQQIDLDAVLDALPPQATVELSVRAGDFVTEGIRLATIRTGPTGAPHERVTAAVRAAVEIGADPTLEQDLGYGIALLVDIAERAGSETGSDSTTVREVILHLGIVLRALLLRDLPPTWRTAGAGRAVLLPHQQSFGDYVSIAFERIRLTGAQSPTIARCLLSTIEMLVGQLEDAGLPDRAAPLVREARLVLDSAKESLTLSADYERLCDQVTPWLARTGDPEASPRPVAARR
ncbi:DUF2254 domain-containing protein [Pseudonocardia sp. KRD-182]|uniref:DUF2254 family protein n=1 Tax=Pseudonocardia oceani TaxID=2792013 RepID=UPI001C4A2724|nr:DUF2254 family protein [Pseudonocardia oceani]MBW0108605.1 DUF2254 domain-containing protein [Pseudonocardia oceani]